MKMNMAARAAALDVAKAEAARLGHGHNYGVTRDGRPIVAGRVLEASSPAKPSAARPAPSPRPTSPKASKPAPKRAPSRAELRSLERRIDAEIANHDETRAVNARVDRAMGLAPASPTIEKRGSTVYLGSAPPPSSEDAELAAVDRAMGLAPSTPKTTRRGTAVYMGTPPDALR